MDKTNAFMWENLEYIEEHVLEILNEEESLDIWPVYEHLLKKINQHPRLGLAHNGKCRATYVEDLDYIQVYDLTVILVV